MSERWVPLPEWNVTSVELMQAQQRLLIDFMQVALTHATPDYMRECCRKFDDLHYKIITALQPPTIPTEQP